ncbi:MAG TPA: MASE3 domain-containing protein [Candidatus Paceibacterota bacterium]
MWSLLNRLHRRFFPIPVLVGISILPLVTLLGATFYRDRFYFVFGAANYLDYHNLVEALSVVVAFSIFSAGWFTYKQSKNERMLFLGVMFLSVGIFDFLHLLNFPGMPGLITASSTDKGAQFWIWGRLLSAIALLIASFVPPYSKKPLIPRHAFLVLMLAIPALMFVAITFYPQYMPAMFMPGVGLTPFKIGCEYVIIAIFAAAFFAFVHRYRITGDKLLVYYMCAIILSIFSELAFTLYASAYDTFNMLGHAYKFAAYGFIYSGIFLVSVGRPYVELEESEKKLERMVHTFEVLSSCNQVLIHAEDESKLLQKICQTIADVGRFRLVWIGYAQRDKDKSVTLMTSAGYGARGFFEEFDSTWSARGKGGRGPSGLAIANKKPVISQDISTDPKFVSMRGEALKRGYASAIALPLTIDGTIVGVLGAYAKDPNAFDAKEVGLLVELAGDISFGIKTLRTAAEKKRADELLAVNESRLREAQKIARVGNWEWNVANDTIWWSDEYYRLFGLKPGSPTPNYTEHLKAYTAESAAQLEAAVKNSMKTGEPYELELEFAKPTTTTRWIAARGQAKIDADGKVIGLYGTAQDITQTKAVEKMRNDFLSLASHQLRTPLSGTKWLIETLESGKLGSLTTKQKEYMDSIYAINERMIKLVLDMLSVLRFESGEIAVVREQIDIRAMLSDIVHAAEPAAKSKQIKVKTVFADEVPLEIESDRTLLSAILECLVSNGVDYSSNKHEVLVTVGFEKVSNTVEVSVQDLGIGIPKDEQGKIFERFYRASNAKKIKPGGTGLGLYIAQFLAERVGGRITFESEESRGSTFTLHIPTTLSAS